MTTAISPTCKICQSPDIDDINAKLIAGISSRKVGVLYDLHYKSLLRHKKEHLPKQMIRAQGLQDQSAADQLLARVEDLYDKSLLIIEKADNDKKWTAATGAIREARQALELVARLLGELRTGTTINILYNEEFTEVRLVIINALIKYPEAKQAVIDALQEKGAIEDAEYAEVNPAQLGSGSIR